MVMTPSRTNTEFLADRQREVFRRLVEAWSGMASLLRLERGEGGRRPDEGSVFVIRRFKNFLQFPFQMFSAEFHLVFIATFERE